MAATRVEDLADRPVDELSGGQRQRVWLAMVLAQDTPLLLLDEPTTFLDLQHQIEVLDLCAQLHAPGRTLVAVLHDLNQACRYATHLIAMRDGRVVARGAPDGGRRRRARRAGLRRPLPGHRGPGDRDAADHPDRTSFTVAGFAPASVSVAVSERRASARRAAEESLSVTFAVAPGLTVLRPDAIVAARLRPGSLARSVSAALQLFAARAGQLASAVSAPRLETV